MSRKFYITILLLACSAHTMGDELPGYIQTLVDGGVVVEKEALEGYELDSTLLRQEALGVALKATRQKLKSSDCQDIFEDVSSGKPNIWLCPVLTHSVQEGRISASNDRFRPEDPLTRSEALAMLIYPQCTGEVYTQDESKYTWDQDLDDWQKRTIALALHSSIIVDTIGTDWDAPIARNEYFWWAYKVYTQQIVSCFRHKPISYYHDFSHYEKSIRVDTYAEQLHFYEYGNHIGSITISSGNNSHLTPSGRFQITNKHTKMLSKSTGLWMPYWMEFYDGKYGFHALPITYNGESVRDESVLGRSAAGGCVRMSESDAKGLYEWADTGTTVLIHHNDRY